MFDVQEEINSSMLQGPTDPALDISTTDLEAELEEILSGGTDVATGGDLHFADQDRKPPLIDNGRVTIKYDFLFFSSTIC